MKLKCKIVFPIYFMGGIVGALAYIVSYYFLSGMLFSLMVGASAAIMALVIVAGRINPDKEVNLILLGPVKIKFIVLAFILIDLIFIGKNSNTGGHIAHIGGMVMGWLYYNQIGSRNEIEPKINGVLDWISGLFEGRRVRERSPLKVKFKSDKIKTMSDYRSESETNMQAKVDAILDKIKKHGYDSLTDIEKEFMVREAVRESVHCLNERIKE